MLHYSSVAHLSNQFKKNAGFLPHFFQKTKRIATRIWKTCNICKHVRSECNSYNTLYDFLCSWWYNTMNNEQ
jgi:hypothetical protein